MKVNKAELQKALEKVKPGLAKRELIEQSMSFSFLGDRVITYNDEISISHPVKGLDIKGAIKAQALYSFLDKIKKEEIDISCTDNQVIIKTGKAKAGLLFEQEVVLPIEQEIGKVTKWYPISDELKEALKLCHSCCSKDMSNPILTCVHVGGDTIEASDSYQIIQYTSETCCPIPEFSIPATTVRDLIKYDITDIAEGDGWVHFMTKDDTVFSARVLMDKYPSTSKHLEVKGPEFIFPKDISSILEKANVFARSDFSTDNLSLVTIEIKDKKIKISAKNEYGWFKEFAETDYEGPTIKFTAGVDFLIDVFTKLKTCILDEGKIGFIGDNWKHVIATVVEGDNE